MFLFKVFYLSLLSSALIQSGKLKNSLLKQALKTFVADGNVVAGKPSANQNARISEERRYDPGTRLDRYFATGGRMSYN